VAAKAFGTKAATNVFELLDGRSSEMVWRLEKAAARFSRRGRRVPGSGA